MKKSGILVLIFVSLMLGLAACNKANDSTFAGKLEEYFDNTAQLSSAKISIEQRQGTSQGRTITYSLDIENKTALCEGNYNTLFFDGFKYDGNSAIPQAWTKFAFVLNGYDFSNATVSMGFNKFFISGKDFIDYDGIGMAFYSDFSDKIINATVSVDKNKGIWTRQEIIVKDYYEPSANNPTSDLTIIVSMLATDDDVAFEIPSSAQDRVKAAINRSYTGPASFAYDLYYPYWDTRGDRYFEESWAVPEIDGLSVQDFYSYDSFYDPASNVFVCDSVYINTLYVFDQNLFQIKTMTVESLSFAVDNGKLYVFKNHGVYIYSLFSFKRLEAIAFSLDTPYNLENTLHIVQNNLCFLRIGGSSVIVYDLLSNSIVTRYDGYDTWPIEPNKKDNIVYLFNEQTQTLIYVDSSSGLITKTIYSVANEKMYNIFFDGENLHINDNIYDGVTGEKIIITDIITAGLEDFILADIIHVYENYVVATGYNSDNRLLAIYDRNLNQYVFCKAVIHDYYTAMIGQRLMITHSYSRLLIFDMTKFTVPLANNIVADDIISGEDFSKFITKDLYLDACTDNQYIYLLTTGSSVVVLDINTLATVKTLNFEDVPKGIDACDGQLAVSFGNMNYVYLYDTQTFEKTTYNLSISAFNIFIYKQNLIIQGKSSNYYNTAIYIFSLYFGSCVEIAGVDRAVLSLNRADGLLYMATCNTSSGDMYYYDLERGIFLYQSKSYTFEYNSFPITFDGTYVHYYGNMFDKTTGVRLYYTEYEKMLPQEYNGEILGIIYFDGTTSAFATTRDNKQFTVIYDTKTSSSIEIEGHYLSMTKTEQGFILLAPHRHYLAKASF